VNLTIPQPQILPGDYNQDGHVDAADYTVWRDTLGQSVTAGTHADGDGDGMIGSADYDVWKAHFGRTALGSGAGAAIPEPSGVVLLIAGIAMSGIVAMPMLRQSRFSQAVQSSVSASVQFHVN
jgi:hypothetical protein